MKKFKEVNALNDVAQFHETFQLPILDEPVIPSEDRCKLRVNLLEEELKELQEAIAANDLVEVADALCDLQYVLSGAILEFGLADKFKTLFDEVQRSNMSKACKTLQEAEDTVAAYAAKGQDGKITEVNGVFLVHRISDGKVLKSVGYSAAELGEKLT